MAARALDERAKSDRFLTKARAAFELIPDSKKEDRGPTWHNQLAAELAIKEAAGGSDGN